METGQSELFENIPTDYRDTSEAVKLFENETSIWGKCNSFKCYDSVWVDIRGKCKFSKLLRHHMHSNGDKCDFLKMPKRSRNLVIVLFAVTVVTIDLLGCLYRSQCRNPVTIGVHNSTTSWPVMQCSEFLFPGIRTLSKQIAIQTECISLETLCWNTRPETLHRILQIKLKKKVSRF